MKKHQIDADSALRKVAADNHTTVEDVRREIEAALSEAKRNSDPAIRAWWRQSPWGEKLPTPEEFITFIAECLIK